MNLLDCLQLGTAESLFFDYVKRPFLFIIILD